MSSHIIWNRDIYWRRYKIQETLYIGQWCLSPLQNRHLGTSHCSLNCHQLPHRIFLNLIDGLKSLPFQRLFQFWDKPEATEHQIWAIGRLFCQKTPWDVRHEQVHCCDEAANHQLPIAVAFWITKRVSVAECSSLTQNLMQIHCSTHSVILNVMTTQYTCSLNVIYCPHWLVRWSHHCSCMHNPVHFPWLPAYTDDAQTVIVIFTMAGLFPGRAYIFWKLNPNAMYHWLICSPIQRIPFSFWWWSH